MEILSLREDSGVAQELQTSETSIYLPTSRFQSQSFFFYITHKT